VLVVFAVHRFVGADASDTRRSRWLTRLSGLIMLALGTWVAVGRIG